MPGSIWSRSRFWLCHFLHNRHIRLRAEALPSLKQPERMDQAILTWLQRFAARAQRMPTWLIESALHSHADDPAFVQCLRLWIKEEHYLSKLATQMQRPTLLLPGSAVVSGRMRFIPPLPRLRHHLGLRFEVSILLLGHVIELVSLRHLHAQAQDATLRSSLEQMWRDRQQHVAFASEWLAREFADFNFFRRNLRRLRLRMLFALMLSDYLRHQGATLRTLGLSRGQVFRESWTSFAHLMENMVPYHRDALLHLLLSQREHPYDQPARML